MASTTNHFFSIWLGLGTNVFMFLSETELNSAAGAAIVSSFPDQKQRGNHALLTPGFGPAPQGKRHRKFAPVRKVVGGNIVPRSGTCARIGHFRGNFRKCQEKCWPSERKYRVGGSAEQETWAGRMDRLDGGERDLVHPANSWKMGKSFFATPEFACGGREIRTGLQASNQAGRNGRRHHGGTTCWMPAT